MKDGSLVEPARSTQRECRRRVQIMNQTGQLQPSADKPTRWARTHLRTWIAVLLCCGRKCVRRVVQFLLIAWGALAIYYSNLPWAWARTAMAIVFAGFGLWALWVSRRSTMRWAFAVVFTAVATWWICIPPSNNRPWAREVAVP